MAQMFILNDVVQFVKIKMLDSILLLQWYINKEISKKKDSKNITHCVNGIDLKSLHSRGWFLPFTSLIFSCSSCKFRKYLESNSNGVQQNNVWTTRYNYVTSNTESKKVSLGGSKFLSCPIMMLLRFSLSAARLDNVGTLPSTEMGRNKAPLCTNKKKCSRKKSVGVVFIADSL